MGFLGIFKKKGRRRSSLLKKENIKGIAKTSSKDPPQAATPARESLAATARDLSTTIRDDDESEIIIDEVVKGTPKYYGENESHAFGIKEEAERDNMLTSSSRHSSNNLGVPTSIHNLGFDDVSAISLEHCLRTGANDSMRFVPAFEDAPCEEEEDEREDDDGPSVVIDNHKKSVEVSISVDVDEVRDDEGRRKRRDPGGLDCTSNHGAEKDVVPNHQRRNTPLHQRAEVSPRHYDNPHMPQHLLPQQKAKQRNSLLKYQTKTASKATQMKQTIKGYFRYVPKGTEGNDHSVVSC